MLFLTLTRSLFFTLFIVFSSIITCIAAWNLSLAQSLRYHLEIDAFLIFVGTLGLLFAFPIVYIDILRKDAITSRVWFEISWVAFFWVLHLSGASALTAIAPQLLCESRGGRFLADACTSTRVLLAFSWMSAIMFLCYLIALVVLTAFHVPKDPHVWHCSVRDVPWFSDAPSKLYKPKPSQLMIHAPQQNTLVHLESGMWDATRKAPFNVVERLEYQAENGYVHTRHQSVHYHHQTRSGPPATQHHHTRSSPQVLRQSVTMSTSLYPSNQPKQAATSQAGPSALAPHAAFVAVPNLYPLAVQQNLPPLPDQPHYHVDQPTPTKRRKPVLPPVSIPPTIVTAVQQSSSSALLHSSAVTSIPTEGSSAFFNSPAVQPTTASTAPTSAGTVSHARKASGPRAPRPRPPPIDVVAASNLRM